MATLELCTGFPSCLIQGGRKLTQSLRIAIFSPPERPLEGLAGRLAGILAGLEAMYAPLGAFLSCLGLSTRTWTKQLSKILRTGVSHHALPHGGRVRARTACGAEAPEA